MRELHLNGMTPQQVIKVMNDVIGRAKGADKRHLVIEEYEETYGDPFCQHPDKALRVVVRKPPARREP